MSDPRPTVGAVTEALYASLPELYRDADAAQDTGPSNYPLLRYLSLLLDQLEPIADVITRLTYIAQDERGTELGGRMGVPEAWQRFGVDEYGDGGYGDAATSDLVDPNRADAAWLPWLAQLLGVAIYPGDTIAETRARLIHPEDAWAHGTPDAIIAVVRRALVDPDAYVDVRPHAGGDPFVINIITTAEAAGGAGASWGVIESYGTWAGIYSGRGDTWADLRGVDVVEVADPERPAGYRFIHTDLEDYTP